MQDIKDLNNYHKAVNKQYSKKGTINDVLNNQYKGGRFICLKKIPLLKKEILESTG